jgi:hypothetical protein
MVVVPKPVTVWTVRLERGGDMKDAKGRLSLEAGSLTFASESGRRDERVSFADIRKVKRTLGSPVLLVEHLDAGAKRVLAFYFVQPPPLPKVHPSAERPEDLTRPNPLETFRSRKSRARRRNAGYLTASHRVTADVVKAWKAAIEEEAGKARG